MRHTAIGVLAFVLSAPGAQAGDHIGDVPARGACLPRITDCGGCPTPRGKDGAPIAEAGRSGGNPGFEIPGVGNLRPPGLAPAAGALGPRSDEDIVAALRTGVGPDRRVPVAAMPRPSRAALTDGDAHAPAAHLRSLDPVAGPILAAVAPGGAAVAPFHRVTLRAQTN